MNLETITEYTDGTCRDINFDEQISQNGLLALLEFINKEWEFKSGYNFGKSFSLEQILIEPPDQFYIDWCNGDNISSIQLFSVKEKTNEFYIELTFFPRDVKKSNLTR